MFGNNGLRKGQRRLRRGTIKSNEHGIESFYQTSPDDGFLRHIGSDDVTVIGSGGATFKGTRRQTVFGMDPVRKRMIEEIVWALPLINEREIKIRVATDRAETDQDRLISVRNPLFEAQQPAKP